MARPLRLEYPGALFHITSRGNDKRLTFFDDVDRRVFLRYLGETVERFRWILTAYVLMPNHFHLFVQLAEKTLSRGMHWLKGKYVQYFNARHARVGHLFQGRFKAPLVEKETYFLELLRYIVLNPVRAGMVARPDDYEWSSYRATAGEIQAPPWLAVDNALIAFAPERNLARALYRQFVFEGVGMRKNPFDALVGGAYLGSAAWLEAVREKVELKPRAAEHPLDQRRVGRATMDDIVSAVAETLRLERDVLRRRGVGPARLVAAWIGANEGLLRNTEIGAGLMVTAARVTGLLKECEQRLREDASLQISVDECVSTLRRKNLIFKT